MEKQNKLYEEVYHCAENHNKGWQLVKSLFNKQCNTDEKKLILCTCLYFVFQNINVMVFLSNNLSKHIMKWQKFNNDHLIQFKSSQFLYI